MHLRLSPRLLSTGRASSGRSSWSCRSCTFSSFISRYRISNHNRSATSYGLSRPRSCDGDMPESLSWWLLPLLHCGLLYVGSRPSPRKSGRVEPRGTFLHKKSTAYYSPGATNHEFKWMRIILRHTLYTSMRKIWLLWFVEKKEKIWLNRFVTKRRKNIAFKIHSS